MAIFEAECLLKCPLERAFEFLTTPLNLPELALTDVNLIIDQAPEQLTLGSTIRFSISAMGQVLRAAHEVTEFDPPHGFVEVQIEGPFKEWTHEHRFTPNDDGTVTVSDRIEFTPPSGILGLLMSESRIRAQLEEGFDHRAWKLAQRLERED